MKDTDQTWGDRIGIRDAIDRRSLWLAAAIVFGSVAYGALTMDPWFDTNDDPTMLGISTGLFSAGVPDPRIVYQSAFIGALVGALAHALPGFDWYSGLQWLVCIGSFLSMNFAVLRRDSSALGWGSAVVFTSTFLPAFLFNLQFVQTSFACLMAGVVSLIDAMRRPVSGIRSFIPAFCWLFAAPLFRHATLMAAQIVLAALFILATLEHSSRRDRAGLRRDASILVTVSLGLALLVSCTRVLELAIFYSEPEWRLFVDQLSARPYVVENWPRWIGLERVVGSLQGRLGLTPEQYFAISAWIPISVEWYSVQSFARMASVVRELDASPESIGAVVASHGAIARTFLSKTPIVGDCLGLVALLSVLSAAALPDNRRRAIGQAAFWIVLAGVIWLGVSVAFRPPPSRVWLPILALSAWGSLITRGVLVSDLVHRPNAWTRWDALPMVVLGIALAGPFPIHSSMLQKVRASEEAQAARCESTDRHIRALERIPKSATIFLAPRVVHSDCFIRPFARREYPDVLLERTVSFGWRVLTPPIHARLFARDSNLFDAICRDPENAFVADPQTHATVVRYLARHEPDVEIVRYSSDLPASIRTCRASGESVR